MNKIDLYSISAIAGAVIGVIYAIVVVAIKWCWGGI